MNTNAICIGCLLLLAACGGGTRTVDTGIPSIGSASDVTPLKGMRASQGELAVQQLGFELARNDGRTNYWFNRGTDACARIRTEDGLFADVTMLSAASC